MRGFFIMCIRLFCLVIMSFALIPSQTHAQSDSCIDAFHSIASTESEIWSPVEQEVGHIAEVSWYSDSRCLLIASTTGLWLYDINQPNSPRLFTSPGSSEAIGNIAINPTDSSFAFNVEEETIVHLVNPNGTESTIQAEGEAITEIAFSSDGALIAVASSDIEDDWGFQLDARVQIFNVATRGEIAHITSKTGAIEKIAFGPSDQHLLTQGFLAGYVGVDLEYWDVTTSSRLWAYYDQLWKMQETREDRLLPLDSTMQGSDVAIWGLYGYMNDDNYYGGAVHIWDAELQERRLEIIVKHRNIQDDLYIGYAVTFNSDGSVLASYVFKGTITFWDVTDGSKLAEIDTHLTSVRQVSFSPDNWFLAITAGDEVHIWDIDQMRIYSTFG
jgi:WD40 repeat protein